MDDLRRMRDELEARNQDNVSRTASYLELYAWTVAHPPDLPWVLMAHLVSRNAGYLMTDLARRIPAMPEPSIAEAMRTLFVLLERANFLIFHDAWHHVSSYLLGESASLAPPRTPAFACAAWARHRAALEAAGPSAALERALVLDLVHNEQHFIEHRAVHHPDLSAGLELLRMIEASGMDKPIVLPWPGPGAAPEIRASEFDKVERRIATGARIFDEALADPARRRAMFEWALVHPHTGSREVYGGKPGPTLREAWPVERVRALSALVHAAPEVDPSYP